MAEPLLELSDVHVRYGGIEAVKGVSISITEHETVTLIGGNGAGKTTTLKTISGVKRSVGGSIRLRGERIDGLPADEIVDLGVCQVPEGRRIFPRMTVLENLHMGAFTRRDRPAVETDLERVFRLFPLLRERQRQPGGTLSGGEQQMLAIGRAMMARPSLLMLDEPSLGLAPIMVERIFELLREIRDRGITILLVEQNAHMALRLADRGYVIESGQIVLEDRAEELLGNDAVRKAYLGET